MLTLCRLSYVPCIAPSTTLDRINYLCSVADSLVYVVSKVLPLFIVFSMHWSSSYIHWQMGTTGSSIKGEFNADLPNILKRIHDFTELPLVVGFGIATSSHFDYVANAGADGVVIGSHLVHVIDESPSGQIAERVEAYCRKVSRRDGPHSQLPVMPRVTYTKRAAKDTNTRGLQSSFGMYGGQYVPEALVGCLVELESVHKSAMTDPKFYQEFRSHFSYINRPSDLYLAKNLTEYVGGANIWLKREDL